MKISTFVGISGVLGLIMIVGAYGAHLSLGEGTFTPMLAAIILGWVMSVGAYIMVFPSLDKPFRVFTAMLLSSTMLRLLLGILTVLLIALLKKEWLKIYVVTFFIGYFIFVGFEVYTFMRNLRPFSEKDVPHSSKKNNA